MNFLARTLLTVRWTTALNIGITVLVLAVIAALEILGRTMQNDLQDAVYLLVLMSLGLGIIGWHRRRPLKWVTFVLGSFLLLWVTLRNRSYEHGLDFRGTPAYPQRWPAPFFFFVGFCLLFSGLAVLATYTDFQTWRQPVVNVSYTAYLVLLFLHWVSLLVLLVVGMAFPLMRLDHWLKQERETRERRLFVFLAGLVLLAIVCCAAKWLPTALPLGFITLALLATLVVLFVPTREGLSVIWRRVNRKTFFAIPLHRVFAAIGACVLLLAITHLLIGRAGQLLTPPKDGDPMSLSATMAGLAAWALPGAILVVLLRVLDEHRHNPVRRTALTIHYVNKCSLEAGDAMRAEVQRRGWNLRSPLETPERGDVRLELVPTEESQATEFQPNWPLRFHPNDLVDPEVVHRLERRDVIQLRRRFTKTLTRLFKHLAGTKAMARGGCWFAPHWWFISGLGIETSRRRPGMKPRRRALRRFGPTYHDLFGPRIRQHLHEVLRAVQIDIIYIEAGISAKSLIAVLRQVFEVYDIHGGQRIVDDHSFTGISKVRVTLHQLEPSVAEAGSYDDLNPKFDELSRGRILHIFRDQGEFEEVGTSPKDFDYVPSPSLIG
jgi:hypothetical protein